MPRSPTRSLRFVAWCLPAMMLLTGCSNDDGIAQYTVPKPRPIKVVVDPAEKAPRPGQGMSLPQQGDILFGAIMLRGEQAWFFKTTAPRQVLGTYLKSLAQVIHSVRFEADGTPAWTLAEGMQQLPGDNNRFATIAYGPSGALQMSVTVLPKKDADEPYLLANINRWRNQLQLPPTTLEDLKDDVTPMPLANGNSAYIVLLGLDDPSAAPPPANQGPAIALKKYDTPTGWTDRGAGGGRLASFAISDGSKSAEVVVTSFPAVGAMADTVENINRWRGQVKLPRQTAAEIAGEAKQISISGSRAVYIELFPPMEATEKQAILAAMCQVGGNVLFFKLSGDADLAKRESENLKKFLESVRLEPQGATDGK